MGIQLIKKGEQSTITTIEQAKVEMSWMSAADFDLAAHITMKNGTEDFAYFGAQKGKLGIVEISEDEGVGDSVGEDGNSEDLIIPNLENVARIDFLCWDYGAVNKGKAARFQDGRLGLVLTDQNGNETQLTAETGDAGNACCIGSIVAEGSGHVVKNISKSTTLKSFPSNTDDFSVLYG
jgi:hypothetical protein